MDKKLFEDCVHASVAGTKKFPEIVGDLLKIGVESYHVDLIRGENRFYLPCGELQSISVAYGPFNRFD